MKLFSSPFKTTTLSLLLLISTNLTAQERGINYVGVTKEEAAKGSPPQLWGVVIGISRYQRGDVEQDGGRISNLKYAHSDAQAIYNFLRSEAGGSFKDRAEGGHLILLRDEQATLQAVENALAYLKQARPQDYFIIYIAAHGVLVPEVNEKNNHTTKIPYFVLHDTNIPDASRTALRMEKLADLVRSLPAKRGLVLSDTCHSAGVLMPGRGLRDTIEATSEFIEKMKMIPEGIGFLAAASAEESSYENKDLFAGVFTWNLLQGLRGIADTNRDGTVTFKEIKDHLLLKVPEMTGRKQNPAFNITKLEANDIPLSLVSYAKASVPVTATPASVTPSPPPATRPASAAVAYGQLIIRTPDIDGVELSINDEPAGVLSSTLEKSIQVPAGRYKIRFTKGHLRYEQERHIEAEKTEPLEVNLTFAPEEGEPLIAPPAETQTIINLQDNRLPVPTAESFLQSGVDRFNKQQFPEAIELFNRAIQANGGTYAQALVYRGRAEQLLDQKAAAIQSFQAAVNQLPTIETRTFLAEAKLNQGRVEEAQVELQAIIDKYRYNRRSDFARVVLADVLLTRGDLIGAERHARSAVQLNPNSPPAYLILADALMGQFDFDKQKEAVEMAQKALQLFEELARKKVSIAKGVRYLSLSHLIFGGAHYANKAAIAEAHQAVAKTINHLVEQNPLMKQHNQLTSLERRGYLNRAQQHIQEALQLAQTFTDNRRYVLSLETSARHAFLRGEVMTAIKEAEKVVKIARSAPALQEAEAHAHFTLYMAYNSQQKYAQAADHLKEFLVITGHKLTPEEKQELQEEWEQIKREADAHRKKK
jgi:tetratricopeptide (TPR) repeat protein